MVLHRSEPANRLTGIHRPAICRFHVALRVTRMNFLVLNQAVGLRERLAARLADIRLLPRMRTDVHSQVTGLRERLAACLTDVRLLPRMRGHGIFKPNKRLTWSA